MLEIYYADSMPDLIGAYVTPNRPSRAALAGAFCPHPRGRAQRGSSFLRAAGPCHPDSSASRSCSPAPDEPKSINQTETVMVSF